MPRHKHIRGLDAVRVADEMAQREPVKLVSSTGRKQNEVISIASARTASNQRERGRLFTEQDCTVQLNEIA
jgi:hypothetical protein